MVSGCFGFFFLLGRLLVLETPDAGLDKAGLDMVSDVGVGGGGAAPFFHEKSEDFVVSARKEQTGKKTIIQLNQLTIDFGQAKN